MAKSLGALIIDLALNTARIDKGITSTNKKLDSFAKQTRSIARIAGAAFASIQIGGLIKDISDVNDKYKLLEGRLRLVQKEGENLSETQERLFDVAQRTRSETGAVIDFYTQLSRATKNLNVSQETLIQTTETINKAITISGASSASASAALFQLQQGLAAGALRGQELNSVLEQTPRVAEAIADGLGVTIGQLRKLGEEGKLTAEVLLGALQKQAGVIDSEFSRVPKTVGQAFTQLTNDIEKLISGFDGVNKVIRYGIESFRELVKSIQDYADSEEKAAEAQKKFNELIKPNITLLQEYGIILKGVDPSSLEDVNRILKAAELNSINLVNASKYNEITVQIAGLQQRLSGLLIAQNSLSASTLATNEQRKENARVIELTKQKIDALIKSYQKVGEAEKPKIIPLSQEKRIELLSAQETLLRENFDAQEKANNSLLVAESLYQGNIISLDAYRQKVIEANNALTEFADKNKQFQGFTGPGSSYTEELKADQEAQDARLAQDREARFQRVRQAQEEKEELERIERLKNDNILSSTASLFGSLSAIVGSGSKKAFNLSKQLARAETIISTYAAAQKAYEWASKFGGPPAGALAAAAAVGSGLARLSAINRTTFESSSSAAASTGAGSFVPSPTPGPLTPGQTNAAQGQTFIIISGNGEQPLTDSQIDRLMTDISKRVNEGSQVIIRRDSVQAQEIARAVA